MTSPTVGRRFMIMGLPRSGTTYLMTLLNSHPKIHCAGELFNPHAIITADGKDNTPQKIHERDSGPHAFIESFYSGQEQKDWDRIGFKFMIGHNIRVLRNFAKYEDVSLIYVHRENKLAQAASLAKAAQSKIWAQTKVNEHVAKKIDLSPLQISQRMHEYETFDFLFRLWFRKLPNHKMQVEYRDMFKPGFEDDLCNFLGVQRDRMKSPLVKQGENHILDRFEKPKPISAYFRRIGKAEWLEDELQE